MYQMVSVSPQQCIRVLILLHEVGSEIVVVLYVHRVSEKKHPLILLAIS